MRRSSKILFKAFLQTLPPSEKECYIQFFPEEFQKSLSSLPQVKVPKASDFSQKSLWKKVHYSWFIPTLRSYGKKDAALFLSALPEEMAKSLQRPLEISEILPVNSASFSFLQNHLLSSLVEEKHDLLPISYLSHSPIASLTQFSKKELIQVIEYLALYDLAFELKHIVDTKLLKQINQILQDHQKSFLQKIMPQQEGDRLSLQNWDGTKESFYLLLHRKGLKRLGIAVSFEEESLIWYVAHTLDIGRGSALLKICEKKVTPNLSQAIMRNLIDIMPLIKP